jgi:glutamate 5-kinase
MKEVLVLKVGTSTIVDNKADRLDQGSFERIGEQINRLRSTGHGVVMVSSAARRRLPHVGWRGVVQAWSEAVGEEVDDFLLTERELDTENGCDELVAAVHAGRIALANADDDSLRAGSRYRSNDLVGARLGLHALGAGFNVQYGMLSDVHGVYADIGDHGSVISAVDVAAHRHLAGGVGSKGATGGMATKFDAAAETTAEGIRTWVAHGRESSIELAMAGLHGTTFSRADQGTERAQ